MALILKFSLFVPCDQDIANKNAVIWWLSLTSQLDTGGFPRQIVDFNKQKNGKVFQGTKSILLNEFRGSRQNTFCPMVDLFYFAIFNSEIKLD